MELHLTRCNICGDLHNTENCSVLENVEVIKDKPTLSRARLSLPGGLEVVDLTDGSTSVIARNKFKRGVKFGPLVARTTTECDLFSNFPLKLFFEDVEENSDWEYLDTASEDLCNWMCLVSPATCTEEQNLICFQMKREVHFLVIRDVHPGDQLRVWYASYYGIQMSAKQLEPSLKNDEFLPLDYEESEVPSTDICLSPKGKKKRKRKEKTLADELMSIATWNSIELRNELVSKLPSAMLGARDPKRELICSKCSTKSKSFLEHVKHLMTHCKVPVSYKCSACQKNFRTRRTLKKHSSVCKNQMNAEAENVETEVISPAVNELMVLKTDANITEYEKRQLEQSDISNVLNSLTDNTTMKKLLLDDCSRTGKESALHKEYESFLDSLTDFRSNIIGVTNYSSKTDPLKNDNVEKLMNERLSVSVPSPRSKETDNPPILGLGDEIVFQNIKSFTDIDNVVDKDTNHGDKTSFTGNLINHLPNSDITAVKSAIDTCDIAKPDPNDYLILLYGQSMDVTDADKDRLVDNLIKDSEGRLNVNDINCDAELIKEMLNDGDFSASDLGKSTDGDTITDVGFSLSNNTPSVSKFNNSQEESIECRENGVANLTQISSNSTSIKQENVSAMTNISDNLVSVEVAETTHNKSISDSSKTLKIDATKQPVTGDSSEKGGSNSEDDNQVDNKPYNCDICHKKFSESLYLYRHLKGHTGEFTCVNCLRVFARKESLQSHSCSDVAVFHCRLCNTLFKTVSDLKKHKRQHNQPTSSKKTWCKMYVKKELNGDQLSSVSISSKEWVCELCGAKMKSKRGLQYHRIARHTTNKQYSCHYCDRNFHRKDVLETHLNTHLRVKTKCAVCEKLFSGKRALSVHMKLHTGENMHACGVCDKLFNQKKNLVIHQRNIHKIGANWRETGGQAQIKTPKLTKSSENAKQTALTSDTNQQELSLQHKTKTKRKKSQNRIEEYVCRYCHTILRNIKSLKRHLRVKHQDFKQEWTSSEIINSMHVDYEEPAIAAESMPVPQKSEEERIVVFKVENSAVTDNSEEDTTEPSTLDRDKILSLPAVNELGQLDYALTLKTENIEESDVIGYDDPLGMHPLNEPVLFQPEANESAAAYLFETGTVVQSEAQPDKDIFYLVLAPDPETILPI